jgi:hypothetical protein
MKKLHEQLGMCPCYNRGLSGGFGALDLSKMFTDLRQKAEESLMTSAQKEGQKLIDANADKLLQAGAQFLDKGLTNYVSDDPEAVRARLSQYGTAFTKSASAEASASLKQQIADNKWIIVGGVVGAITISALLFGATMKYGASKAKANPKRKKKQTKASKRRQKKRYKRMAETNRKKIRVLATSKKTRKKTKKKK